MHRLRLGERMRLLTPLRGYRLDVDAEPLADLGRVVYRVAKVGAFTIEQHPYAYPDTTRAAEVHVQYGVHGRDVYASGYRLLPESPVVNGVTIGGGAVFDPARFAPEVLDEQRERTWTPTIPMRRGLADGTVHGSVPDATARRVTDIVAALTLDFLAREDHPDLALAQAVRLAPGRLTEHQRQINRLAEEIAEREAALAVERSRADAQLALVVLGGDSTLRTVGAT